MFPFVGSEYTGNMWEMPVRKKKWGYAAVHTIPLQAHKAHLDSSKSVAIQHE